MPTSPDLSSTPATTTTTNGAGNDAEDTNTVPPPLSLAQDHENAVAGKGEGTDEASGDVATSAAATPSSPTRENGDVGDDAQHGGAVDVGAEERGGGVVVVGGLTAISPAAAGLDDAAVADGIGAAAGGGGWGDACECYVQRYVGMVHLMGIVCFSFAGGGCGAQKMVV